MTEEDLFGRIEQLVQREQELRRQSGSDGVSDEDREELRMVEQRLDQCWDLLRQRRARAEFGGHPDDAEPRPVGEVESYRQ